MTEDKGNSRFRRLRSSFRGSRLVPLIGLIFLALCILGYVGLNATRAAPDQPMAYSHRVHVENGIQCLYCHSEATRSQIAGIPSVEKCMGCHAVMATESEAVQVLASYWERGETIPWRRVNDQPDFVYFSHQPHLGAGVNCETCHGNVGAMDLAEATVQMDMGWCINCHENEAPERAAQLADCLVCHK
jgi:hypothetical protein